MASKGCQIPRNTAVGRLVWVLGIQLRSSGRAHACRLSRPSVCIFRQSRELHNSAVLAGQQAPGILLSSLPSVVFTLVLGIWSQILILSGQLLINVAISPRTLNCQSKGNSCSSHLALVNICLFQDFPGTLSVHWTVLSGLLAFFYFVAFFPPFICSFLLVFLRQCYMYPRLAIFSQFSISMTKATYKKKCLIGLLVPKG